MNARLDIQNAVDAPEERSIGRALDALASTDGGTTIVAQFARDCAQQKYGALSKVNYTDVQDVSPSCRDSSAWAAWSEWAHMQGRRHECATYAAYAAFDAQPSVGPQQRAIEAQQKARLCQYLTVGFSAHKLPWPHQVETRRQESCHLSSLPLLTPAHYPGASARRGLFEVI